MLLFACCSLVVDCAVCVGMLFIVLLFYSIYRLLFALWKLWFAVVVGCGVCDLCCLFWLECGFKLCYLFRCWFVLVCVGYLIGFVLNIL